MSVYETQKKMKPSVKKKWVAALRSGEFEQASACLSDGQGGYCCLGVLSELAVREGKAETWHDEGGGTIYFGKKKGDYGDIFLPASVQRWAGLDTDSPWVPYDGSDYGSSLATLNDDGHSFAEIADLIEKYL